MTPSLHKMVNDRLQPKRKRQLYFSGANSDEIYPLLNGVQSFECTDVIPLAYNLAVRMTATKLLATDKGGDTIGDTISNVTNKKTAFLPAERTWIEYRHPQTRGGTREITLLIDDQRSNRLARCLHLVDRGDEIWVAEKNGTLQLTSDASVPVVNASTMASLTAAAGGGEGPISLSARQREQMFTQYYTAQLYALLGMINTPRIFQRIVHQPHAGLQRKMVAAKSLIGKFPLGAWTEILLKVPAPEGGPKSESGTDGYLSGERALHWCRAHLRYRLGQWEIVSDHWRGNPAIGIKQSRYRVEHERNA